MTDPLGAALIHGLDQEAQDEAAAEAARPTDQDAPEPEES